MHGRYERYNDCCQTKVCLLVAGIVYLRLRRVCYVRSMGKSVSNRQGGSFATGQKRVMAIALDYTSLLSDA